MVTQQVTITNKLGLHARAAAKLVQLANQFDSAITLDKEGQRADAKSIMDVLMLMGTVGSKVMILAEGGDEAQALPQVVALFHDKFGEGQ